MELVTVLMSTYNGEKYLQEQLDSIYRQKGVNIKLIIRDDCSTDKTLEILKENKKEHPDMITIIEGKENLKSCKSFFRLISSYTEGSYFALADQDDIWDENKLEVAINMLKECDSSKPALYFSNLRIVDENNNFYRNSHSMTRQVKNKYLSLIQPFATGCTIVYNHSLAKIANGKQPENFSFYFSWLYMVAQFFGTVVYDFEPHINYRQHGNNVIGANLTGKKKNLIRNELKRFNNRNLQPRFDNAVEFLREFGLELSYSDRKKVLEIINYKRTFSNRCTLLFDNDLKVNDLKRRIQNNLLILFGIL